MQALVPIARGAGRLAFAAYKKNRGRRMQNNKWVLGSRIMGRAFDKKSTPRAYFRSIFKRRGRKGSRSNTSSTVALRYNVTQKMSGSPKVQTIQDSDNLDTIHRINNTLNGTARQYIIIPTSEAYFPRLYAIAKQYSKYTCGSINVRYVNSVGADTNGSLYMCFIPRTDVDQENYTMPEDFACVPGNVRGSLGKPLSMSVPRKQMIKNGSDLFCDIGGSDTGPQSLQYYTGTLCIATDNLDVGSGPNDFGQLMIDYTFTFSDPIVSKSTTSTLLTGFGDGLTPELFNPTAFSVRQDDDAISVVKRRPLMILASDMSGDALDFNGVAVQPLTRFVVETGGYTVAVYVFPRLDYRTTITGGAGRTYNLLFMEANPDLLEYFEALSVPPVLSKTTTTTTTTS
jgi:hypothetical protein